MKLDKSQTKAIRHYQGPAMILAGPGSGKTTVITRRIEYLIRQRHVDPSRILVITFSRAAAAEMKQRFEALMNGQRTAVTFGTFHAVYFHILKAAYGYTASNIVKEEQRTQFVREFIHRLRLEYEDEGEFVQNLLSEISLIKNMSLNLDHYYSANCPEEVFRRIFRAYQEFLYQNRLLDFDDMLVYTKELLEKRQDILAAWQKKYCYILIDEFQDINQIQYDIIRMLAAPENHLFIVGDDDQSIYRFRGAKPEIMLNFEKDYPETEKVILDINYRSGTEIVKAAGLLIGHNRTRFRKNIQPAGNTGIPVSVQEFKNQKEQNLAVIREIRSLHEDAGISYDQIAVLFRTNAQPGMFIRQLFDYNIPFISREHLPDIYDHWIASDLFTYLRLARGERSRALFLRVMNRPKRYLSRESLPYELVDFKVWKDYYRNQDWMVQRLEKFRVDLEVIGNMRPFSAVNYIRKGMAYEDFLKEFAEYRRIPLDDLYDILEELQEDARGYESCEEWFRHVDGMKQEREEQAAREITAGPAVRLSTLHGAKGLEFEAVFILDVNEKVMPYKKAVLEADLEEERRMFYVGMTRAKQRLYLFWSRQIHNKEMEPSRFLAECGSAN